MKRLFTFIICALFLQVVKANIKTEFAIEAEMVQQDTNVLLTVIQAPVYIYKNNIIKRRLDT
ncbi:hypothetical protein QN344_03855, partial [Mucilaginibacter sp. 5B2]|nr:hypothetical protein [Mucilaginibacter sp. 5B2]